MVLVESNDIILTINADRYAERLIWPGLRRRTVDFVLDHLLETYREREYEEGIRLEWNELAARWRHEQFYGLIFSRLAHQRVRQTAAGRDTARQLTWIGSNINQIARWANTHASGIEAIDILIRLDELQTEIKEFTEVAMLIKIFPHGQGGGSGPVDYLLRTDYPGRSDTPPTLLHGDADMTRDLIDAQSRKWKFTAGVCSWGSEDTVPPEQERQLMDDWPSQVWNRISTTSSGYGTAMSGAMNCISSSPGLNFLRGKPSTLFRPTGRKILTHSAAKSCA